MSIVFSIIITLNILCGVFILLSGARRDTYYLYALSALNFLSIGFTIVTWQFHSSQNVESAILFSKLQTFFLFSSLPIFMYTFYTWSKFPYMKQSVLFFTVCSTAAILSIFLSESTLRFGQFPELVFYESILGDSLSMLKGEPETAFLAFQSLFLLSALMLLAFAARFYRLKDTVISIFLMITLLMQAGVTLLGFLIDSGAIQLFYLGSLPITVFSALVTLNLAWDLRINRNQADMFRLQNDQTQQAFSILAKSAGHSDTESFFEKMITALYSFTKAELIFFGKTSACEQQVNTLVAIQKGKVIDNFSYDLQHSPCEKVLDEGMCFYPNQVAQLFPKDLMLSEQGFESYVGLPMQDHLGKVVGILVLLDTKETELDINIRQALDVFAARASAELQRQELVNYLKKTAYIDELSGLPNKAKFQEELESTFRNSQKKGLDALLLLIDIDHFNFVNRKHGNDTADTVIKLLGERLLSSDLENSFVARDDGDQFAIIISNLDYKKAETDINKYWRAIQLLVEKPFEIDARVVNITCSMGAVLFPSQAKSSEDAIGSAENALQFAKSKGRNQYAFFDPALLAKLDRQRLIISALKLALTKHDELYMVYQPKVNADKKVLGGESLLRWHSPTLGMVSPGEFIPLAEKSGVIIELGDYVMNKVCQQIHDWQMLGLTPPKIAINMSAHQLDSDDFVKTLKSYLQQYSLSPASIELELTETGLLENKGKAFSRLSSLREAGFSLALDDFGTGYSSLSYLETFPLNVLKIDRAFVQKITTERGLALVKSIIAIAQNMQFDIVAEGTETEEEVKLLTEVGCETFQGYYFSHPLSPQEFAMLIGREKSKADKHASV